MNLLTACLLLGGFLASASAATDKIFCYYGSWAHYRPGDGKVSVDDIDPNLCTHIIYTFMGINTNGDVTILDSWLDIDLKALEKLVNLKKINPKVKVLAAIGGWNQGSINYSNVVANDALRAKHVRNIVEFVKKWNLDGFDYDWEYPNQRGGKPADKQNFIKLCKEVRAAFDAEGKGWLFTAAVGASKHHREASYDVPEMSKYLDFINVMSYDLHYFGEGKTGQNAPLYASSFDTTPELNVYDIFQGWIKDGADPSKLTLGLGFYGRTFTLQNSANNGLGAPTTGPGAAGPYTREAGTLSYAEICNNVKNNGWTSVWDDTQKVPYAYKDNQWVGYDNIKSFEMKVDYAKSLKLGGIMLWSVEQDDLRNLCGDGHYSVLKALNARLGLETGTGEFVPPTTNAPTTPRPTQPTQPGQPGSGNGECNGAGLIPDPTDCGYFYRCEDDGSKYRLQCGAGTLFDKNTKVCNHSALVTC